MAIEDIYSTDITSIMSDYLGVSLTTALIIISIIGIWSLIWKGLALWKSARKNSLIWFIALLVVNTVGILEILYIFVFSKISLENKGKGKTGKKGKPETKNIKQQKSKKPFPKIP